jgi:hypothetical protein
MAARRTLLELLIHAREKTQAEEVVAFNATARAKGEKGAALAIRTLRRWMSGDVVTRPRAAQCRVAQALWGYPIDELLAPPKPGALLALKQAGRELEDRSGGADAVDPMTVERQVTMSARRAQRFTAAAESGGIGRETLDELRDDVRDLANAYLQEPVTTLLGPLAETQEAVFGKLEVRQRPKEAADLYLLAGVVSALLAKVSQDLGRTREAMTQARAAYVCADNAGHIGLRAWSRGLQSLITYWSGRPTEAARYARLGAEELDHHAGSVATWLPALEARAWALAGSDAEAVGAIQRAEDARAAFAADDLDAIGGLFSFPVEKQQYYAAGAYVQLADGPARAEQEASAALELYDRGGEHLAYSDAAGTRAELALARVLGGEIEGAGESLAPVLNLPSEMRITGIVESTARVFHALRRPALHSSPATKTLRGQIEAFTRVPAAELTR